MIALAPFLFGLRWLQGIVERATPFWYYLDDEVFALYDPPKHPLKVFSLSDLTEVKWAIGKPLRAHAVLYLTLATSQETLEHRRTLFVAEEETARICERLEAAVRNKKAYAQGGYSCSTCRPTTK